MKYLHFLLFLAIFIHAQELKVDVRPRISDETLVRVVVQIDNNSKRTINHLEGFLVIYQNGKLFREKRLSMIGSKDNALSHGSIVSRSMKLDLLDPFPTYKFNISRVTFLGDYRVYTYHPKIGFYRID